jgi:hypothetical protein
VTTASATALAARPSIAAEALDAAHWTAHDWTTGEKYHLSRHLRHVRTQASHDPADRKYRRAGKHLLNSVAPPNHGQI